jgi:hypothetical protein
MGGRIFPASIAIPGASLTGRMWRREKRLHPPPGAFWGQGRGGGKGRGAPGRFIDTPSSITENVY